MQLPSRVAARVPHGSEAHELNLSSMSSKDLRAMSPATCMAMVAAEEALSDANWKPLEAQDKQATGVAIGMGMVDIEDVLGSGGELEKRYSKVSPYFIPRILLNLAAGHVSMKYGFQGPNHCVSTACATGNHAVGDAFRMIKYGDADVMVCGGSESAITKLGMAGFARLRALSVNFNDEPARASRPFDRDRDGFVMGEGCGVLILEELNHALKRDSKIYAEVLGYGMSGDAHHITAPRDDGTGAKLAMTRCLKEAKVDPSDVGYINAHATSTPMGDEIELKTIESIFFNNELMVSSTKGAIGHLLGAAGAVEGIFTVLACHAGYVPPTANLENLERKTAFNVISKESVPWVERNKRRIALNNSFGFGGTNSCVCFASFEG